MKRYENYIEVDSRWARYIPASWIFSKIAEVFIERKENNDPVKTTDILSLTNTRGVIPYKEKGNIGNKAKEDLTGYRLAYPGDIVFNSMNAVIGSVGLSKYFGAVSPVYYMLYLRDAVTNNIRFFDYVFQDKVFQSGLNGLGNGILEIRMRIPMSKLKYVGVPVPPRDEQDQIVRYLDWQVSKINRLIVAKRRELDLYKEQMCKLFAEAKSDNQKVRLKRVCDLIFDQVEIDPHDQYRKTGMYNRGRGIFRREQIQGNELGDSKFQHITRDCVMLSGQFAWEGAAYITTQADEEGIVSHRYYLLKPTRLTPEYIWAYLMSDEGLLHMQSCSHGSAGRNRPLNINELLNTYIPLPISDEAEQKVVSAVRILMYLNQQKDGILQLYEAMRTRLISDVVTGQIDVRDIEVPEYEVVEDADACEEPEEDTEGEEYEE